MTRAPTLPMRIDAGGFLFLAVKVLSRHLVDEERLAGIMREYAEMRIAEYLEAEQRGAEGVDTYAAYQQSLPLNLPIGNTKR